MGKWGKMVV